ncbi:MAG: hypothetical protein ABIP67_08790 [Burkholderiales bacterium]
MDYYSPRAWRHYAGPFAAAGFAASAAPWARSLGLPINVGIHPIKVTMPTAQNKFTVMLAIIGSRRADLAACTSMMNCFSGLIALVHMPCRILALFRAVLWNRHFYLFFYTSIGICH